MQNLIKQALTDYSTADKSWFEDEQEFSILN